MKRKVIYVFLSSIFLFGCQSAVLIDHLIGYYYLTAPDDDTQCSLTFHEPSDGGTYSGIVNQTVFSVGFNGKYIIVKQHPDDNRKIINYFIVPIQDHLTRENINTVFGPLNYDRFIAKRHELMIPDSLQFTKEYEDLK